MRKISWLSMSCIAACVVPLVAGDNYATSREATAGRSRLLIFSKNKAKVQAEDEEAAGVTRLADPADDAESEDVPVRRPVRSGNTGTVAPRSPAARPTQPAKAPLTKARPAPTQRQLTPAEEDAELARQLFESDEIDREEAAAAARTSKSATKPNPYKELLETEQPKFEGPVARKPADKADGIRPVSGKSDEDLEYEVNPFEPSERPTRVINAGFETDKAKSASRVKPVSATSTTRVAPAVKTKKVVAPVVATPTIKSAPVVAKPTVAAAPTVTTGVGNHTPQVDVKWEARGEVTLGQECHCALIVNNSGSLPCKDLIVEANFPESVRLLDSQPFPQPNTSKLEWHFTNLDAGEQRTIELTIVPTKAGELAASAQVRFTGVAATSFKVSEPLLAASIKVPAEVRIGDPIAANVTVSNPGTGTIKNVILKSTLPEGLDCKTGAEYVSEIGPLGPGESRAVRIGLVAVAGGDQALKVVVSAGESNLEQAAQARIRVLAPSVTLSASGPSMRYLNRAAKYTLTATNDSNAACDNVRITQHLGNGFTFVKADHTGRWDGQSKTVSWFVGQMQPGQTKTVEVELMPKEMGEFQQEFRVTGDAGIEAVTSVVTRVEGAASLVMEVKDGEDPIEVGTDMVYSIVVRNEGSKSAGKVAISCELPPDVELVHVDGPTQHQVESGMLIFKPVAKLAANDSVTFKITIKGQAAGNTKLRARLTSEAIQKPLIVEEATQFYAE